MAWRATRSTPARSTPTCPTSPARASCSSRAGRRLSAVRHAQRAHAVGRSTASPARTITRASTSSSACTAWANRCTKQVEARSRGQAEPPVPRLRAGGHARNAAGLPRAPPAGKRRQHVVREPHRRPVHCRSRNWWPTRSASIEQMATEGASACRTRAFRCRVTCTAPSAPTRSGIDMAERTSSGVAVPARFSLPRTTTGTPHRYSAAASSNEAPVPRLEPVRSARRVGYVQEATVEDVEQRDPRALQRRADLAGHTARRTRPMPGMPPT